MPGLQRRNGGTSESRGRKIYAALSVLFGWLARHRRVPSNPCAGVWRPSAPPARDRVLSDAEIAAFWRACDAVAAPFGGNQLMLLPEPGKTKWPACATSLSADGTTWTVPGTRTKNHRGLVVPLAPLAREIIAALPVIEGAGFVFTTNGRRKISGWSKGKPRLDAQMPNVKPWRIHDLRRTCASGMQRLGVPTEVIERALNHVSGAYGGVAGIYQRDPMTEEVTAALLRWAQHVAGLASAAPGKIVPLRGGHEGQAR